MSNKMKRIEIIYSQALHEDIFEYLSNIEGAKSYTCLPVAHGRGFTDPKMGDEIWPEENEVLIIYTESEKTLNDITSTIETVKKNYPREGCAMFVMESM